MRRLFQLEIARNLNKAFIEIEKYSEKQEDPSSVWKFIRGKSFIEIFQYAVVLRNKTNAIDILKRQNQIQKLNEWLSEEQLPPEAEAEIKKLIQQLKEEILFIEEFGTLLVHQEGFDFHKYLVEQENLKNRIRGRWEEIFESKVSDADRIQIVSTGYHGDESGIIVHEILGKGKILEFIETLEINEQESGGYCFCSGDAILRFLIGTREIASVSYHHGYSMRWIDGSWPGDGEIHERKRIPLVKWFSENGYDIFEKKNIKNLAQPVGGANGFPLRGKP